MSEKPILAFAAEARSRSDEERLHAALKQFVEEDSTLHVRTDPDTKQVIVGGMTERQLEIIVERLTRDFHVKASFGLLRVVFKEMFTRPADGEGEFVRHSGGRGHYAHARIHLIPGELWSGFVFKNATYSESVPARFIQSTEEGIRRAVTRRSLLRSGVDDAVDVEIELYDGSYHDVDSSEAAFRTAGEMAFEDASKKARPLLAEPVMRIEVEVGEDYVGEVMGDLSKRRGKIESFQSRDEARVIGARVPLSTLIGYDGYLRVLGERATCSIQFYGYEPCTVQPDSDHDESSSVRVPRSPAPTMDDLSIGISEPDEE